MKKITFILVIVLLTACSGVKQTEQALYSGNYDTAITKAVNKLQNNINRKNSDEYVVLLEDAYAKANEKDLEKIASLQQADNAAYLEEIYTLYIALANRQNYIKPLFPLSVASESRIATFHISDYTTDIATAKTALSEYLYQTAVATLAQEQPKYVYRNVYEDLQYLNSLNPSYKDTETLLQEALDKGTEHIAVTIANATNVMIPYQLEQELLDFNSYGLSSNWTVFDSHPQNDITYDYQITMNFETIEVGPEYVKEKEYITEKQVVDGKTYVYDEDGNKVKDSEGNYIMTDRYKTVVCTFYQFTQNKTAKVTASVALYDVKANEVLDSYPLSSQFVFKNSYGTHKGDRRALGTSQLDLLEVAALDFPTDEQMVYDAAENLKDKMKRILKEYTL
ncbi:hypothetical protein NBRC110019_14770 [Neptunitalea chrysea]|uniref:Lipoprotein n=1 Tax=Neptunitalea chrysea TaxID=1647581 RepID=A0A9W6B6Z6_9FLAO|nr:hypothetical protein [Neptunitalea chrysea]GLB52437.1 hypothetical protein NBRC110019_14770 [Neptunitalea chrysea]